MKKITQEEISTLVASQVNEMELSGIFNEDTLAKIQEKVSKRLEEDKSLEEDKVLEEEVMPEQEEGEVEITPSEAPVSDVPVVTPEPTYEPELPDFIEKIEPAKFIIFDMNEVSLGGEQLSNKPFRLYADPDTKKSLHDCWKEEGKKTGEVYIAKFEKIGNVEFDYRNGTSHFTEKRFEEPVDTSASVHHDNPYASEATPQEMEEKPVEMAVQNAVDVEEQVKSYIEDILRKHFSNPTEEVPSNAQIMPAPTEYMEEPEDSMVPMVAESDLKYKEIVMNEKEYVKVDTPDQLKESIKNGDGAAKLLSKSDSVQTWVLEGVEYYLPSDIISDKKCHTKNVETL